MYYVIGIKHYGEMVLRNIRNRNWLFGCYASFIQILVERNALTQRKNDTYSLYVVSLPEFTTIIDKQALHNIPSDSQARKNTNLLSIYPNPFSMQTKIGFQLKHQEHVGIMIHNALGQEIKILENSVKQSGYYTITWDGKDSRGLTVSHGIYFLTLKSGEYKETKKVLFMK